MKGKDNTQKGELTPKQLMFCEQYLIDRNGTQAAIRAGYSSKTANEQASRLLANVKIQQYIKAKTQKVLDKMEITQEKVMREYARLAFSDLRQYYNEDGSLKNIHDISDDAAAALAGLESDELWETDEDGAKKPVGVTRKIKIWGKREALDSICKVKGWNAPEKKDHTTNGESLNKLPDLSGLTAEELRVLAKLKRKIDVERI